LAVEAQRKKLGEKENAAGEISSRARGDQRFARWMAVAFERATQNFPQGKPWRPFDKVKFAPCNVILSTAQPFK